MKQKVKCIIFFFLIIIIVVLTACLAVVCFFLFTYYVLKHIWFSPSSPVNSCHPCSLNNYVGKKNYKWLLCLGLHISRPQTLKLDAKVKILSQCIVNNNNNNYTVTKRCHRAICTVWKQSRAGRPLLTDLSESSVVAAVPRRQRTVCGACFASPRLLCVSALNHDKPTHYGHENLYSC